MEMLKETANPDSQLDDVPSLWEAEEIQELSQGEDVELEELSPWGFENYQEALQWGEERVYELFQWELERYQEVSQWGEERVQELPQWEGKRAEELSQAEDDSPQVLWQREGSMEQELSEGEVRVEPEMSAGEVRVGGEPEQSQEGDHIEQELWQENWSFAKEEQVCKYITIRTIWVNPKYPELLQEPQPAPQDWALAASCPGSAEQVPEAGAESQVPRKRPSRCRRVLRALRRLLRIPCLAGRPED